ncbi:MAG: hypothetical protein OEY93_03175 [Anaerolineae bacterium]|nr:hypothetical protein [Anaerolineae bacterium]
MKQKILLLGLVMLIVFPLNFLRLFSPALRQAFDHVFDPEWVHIVGHLGLYAALVVLLRILFHLPAKPLTVALIAGVILILGGTQEYLQLIFKGRPFGPADLFDLQVDLAGGALGWLASSFPGIDPSLKRSARNS